MRSPNGHEPGMDLDPSHAQKTYSSTPKASKAHEDNVPISKKEHTLCNHENDTRI